MEKYEADVITDLSEKMKPEIEKLAKAFAKEIKTGEYAKNLIEVKTEEKEDPLGSLVSLYTTYTAALDIKSEEDNLDFSICMDVKIYVKDNLAKKEEEEKNISVLVPKEDIIRDDKGKIIGVKNSDENPE